VTLDSTYPEEQPVTMPMAPSAPAPSAPRGASDVKAPVRTDYASTAHMVHDILSLGSEHPSAPREVSRRPTGPPAPPPKASGGSGATDSTVIPVLTDPQVGPRPVPEVPLPYPSDVGLSTSADGTVTPDFFTSSKPRKRTRRGR